MTQKNILTILIVFSFSILMFSTCSNIAEDKPSDKTEVSLNWIIPKSETITYETVMDEIDESTFDIELGDMFNKLSDSNKTNNFFDKLKDIETNTSITTTLSNSEFFENVVDIEMVATPKTSESDKDSELDKFQSMMTGTMLRGSVNKDGTMHSFWVKSNQKNLISIFFELPKDPVSKGETWTLDNVNFIMNDQSFDCTEAEKTNNVTVKDIINRGGETIAIIEYDIQEYVSGDFITPSFGKKSSSSVKTTMKFQYSALGEFSEDQGKWLSLTGIMSLDATGIMNTHQKKKFSLELITD